MFDEGIVSRFWSKVESRAGHECWPWQGALNWKGYGRFYLSQKSYTAAHRFAYELANGSVPRDLVMDHLCRNRACCNPAHLQPVDSKTNVLRGVGLTAINARMTHCKRGHPLGPLRMIGGVVRRECVPCKADRQRARDNARRVQPDSALKQRGVE
jgi:hypothetical protein